MAMNEFLNLNWRIRNPTELESQICFLTDEVVADFYVYKNFNKSIMIKSQKNIKLNVPKEKYVPGKKFFKLIYKRSLLTKQQKSHCLKALKMLQMDKAFNTMTSADKYSHQIYMECKPNIVKEHEMFLNYTRQAWQIMMEDKPLKITAAIRSFSLHHWKENMKRYLEYPQFYKEILQISLNYDESEGSIEYNHLSNLLETGTLARFSHSNLKEFCRLKMVTLPYSDEKIIRKSCRLPVSQDQNVLKLIENNPVDVVISSSGLSQIFDYGDIKSKWIIPVVIKEFSTLKENGVHEKRKVVFIDKVLPNCHPTYQDLKNYAYKQLVKTNFCQYKAFSFPGNEDAENSCEESKEDLEETSGKKKKDLKKIHYNVSYRLWKVKKNNIKSTLMKNKTQDTEINLLVRCKLDACELTESGNLQPVMIKPKLEQQVQFGANIPTKSELAREWASLFFRPYSSLYRARINASLSEVISVEKCSMPKVTTEANNHYNYKSSVGLAILERIMEELKKESLEIGNYLLLHSQKHEFFVSLFKECDETTPNCFDLHLEEATSSIDNHSWPPWLPIDVNYILPVHEDINQVPGTFYGFDKDKSNLSTTGKITKKRKKKKKGVKNKRTATLETQDSMEGKQQ